VSRWQAYLSSATREAVTADITVHRTVSLSYLSRFQVCGGYLELWSHHIGAGTRQVTSSFAGG